MGTFATSSKQLTTMKFPVGVLALAATALALPEADPGYFYNRYYSHPSYYNYRGLYGYGYPRYGYTGYHGLYKRQAAPALEPAKHHPKKREMEAGPEAYWDGNYFNGYAHYPQYNNAATA